MGCSHSEFIAVTKNVVSPSQLFASNTIGTDPENSSSLTQDELEKVQVIWKLVGDDKEFLTLVMIRLFVMHPYLREKWIFARDLQTEEEIRGNPQIKYHASQIAELLNKFISEVNEFNSRDLLEITHLGRNHHSYGVRPEDFQHFEECLFYCFEQKIHERIFNEAARKAWKKFFWKLVSKLCEGIYLSDIEELKNNQDDSDKKPTKLKKLN